jgi:LacI family transcriptional regulator
MSKVTQSTIAKIHGVSRQAVGCALGLYTNANIKLNPETREKIRKTSEELGYRPNRLAQLISGRPSGVIGVINFGGVGQMSAQTGLAVANAVHSAGYQLMVYDATWYEEKDIGNVVTALLDFKVQGIILISPTNWLPPSAVHAIKNSGTPIVAMGGGVHLEGVPQVESDYEEDTLLLTTALLDAGYRSFVFLTDYLGTVAGTNNFNPRVRRLQGFTKALLSRGGVVSESPFFSGRPEICGEIYAASLKTDWTDPYKVGELSMQQILVRKELPEVVLCLNDDWAVGAMKACGEAGFSVPNDIAIVGNDGTKVAGYGLVPITTIQLSLDEMAKEATSMLEALIHQESSPDSNEIRKIPGKLLWRASSEKDTAGADSRAVQK